MGKFGEVAVEATRRLNSAEVSDPREAWHSAAQALGCSQDMAVKSCPRSAYLGLCEEGLVNGAPRGRWTKSVDNKRYAVDAVRSLRKCPSWLYKPTTCLWREVIQPRIIRHNDQIDVVFELWRNGLITQEPIPERISN
jgi:hypothetical protein